MDIGTWLAGLGLGQYETTFRENAIDADVLPELTEQHLSEMGVALGHRLKILRAIRQLGREVVAPLEAGDRRQLTIMFCDLVGSTALTAQLDPEDMSDLIRAFQGAITATMARFDGHIAKPTRCASPSSATSSRCAPHWMRFARRGALSAAL